jgi:glyoxylase-like metal-dependent hydrolase (beta-lactamase superfamily II)
LLLITDDHIDHVGTTAHFAKPSGATAAVMNRDFQNLNSGGKADPVYGTKPPFYFPPVTAERVLKDENTLSDTQGTQRPGLRPSAGARITWSFPVVPG